MLNVLLNNLYIDFVNILIINLSNYSDQSTAGDGQFSSIESIQNIHSNIVFSIIFIKLAMGD